VAESVLCCWAPSTNLRKNPEIRAGRVVRWRAVKPTDVRNTINPELIVCARLLFLIDDADS